MVGTVTYDPTTNIITAVGGTSEAPIGVLDLYNADKAGTLELLPSTAKGDTRGYSIDTTTKGTWVGVYGAKGYTLLNWSGLGSHVESLPPFVGSITKNGGNAQFYVGTSFVTALHPTSGTGLRNLGLLYGDTGTYLTVNFNAAWTGRISVYIVDSGVSARGETVSLTDKIGTLTSHDYDNANFYNGVWITFKGVEADATHPVTINLTKTKGPNCVISALMIDSVPASDSSLSLTRQIRPTDAIALKVNLNVTTVYGTVDVTLAGVDKDGNAQTETLTLNTTGIATSTKWYSSINVNGVTVTTDVDEYVIFSIYQNQWGVAWKTGGAQYQFDCRIVLGNGNTATYFGDSNKQITFSAAAVSANNQYYLFVSAAATLRLGTLLDASAKTTVDGCTVLTQDSNNWAAVIGASAATTEIDLYSCHIAHSTTSRNIMLTQTVTGTIRIYNTNFVRVEMNMVSSNLDIYRVTAQNSAYLGYGPGGGTVSDLLVVNPSYIGIEMGGDIPETINGAKIVGNPTHPLAMYTSRPPDKYLINCELPAWTIFWMTGTETAKVIRQYTFDLAVTDKDNNPLQNATVALTDKDGNQVFSVNTDANGAIATQTVTRGTYQSSTGSTLQDSSPHTLTIKKNGYQTYTKRLVLTEKTKWALKLAKTQPVLLDVGNPVLNLEATNPENKLVLHL